MEARQKINELHQEAINELIALESEIAQMKQENHKLAGQLVWYIDKSNEELTLRLKEKSSRENAWFAVALLLAVNIVIFVNCYFN